MRAVRRVGKSDGHGTVLIAVAKSLALICRSRAAMQIGVLALRHQLAVYQRAGRRPQLRPADRILWAWLSRAWPDGERPS